MSISHSLSNALTGLTASSRMAELVSNNVANATNENYARREVELMSHSVGGRGAGVQVVAVHRMVDQALLSDRRQADASLGETTVKSNFYGQLEQLAGTPESADSLGARVAAFESSLIEAASRPDSLPRLQTVADSANALANQINRIGNGIQDMRMDAERQIEGQVDLLNKTITQVAEINQRIISARQTDMDTSALEDQRQTSIDRISSIVPLHVMQRENGAVALYTTRGTMLVDGHTSKVDFERTPKITATMEHPGLLQGLTVNGKEIREAGRGSSLGGGSLGALFQMRDEIAVEAQTRIDAVALDLVGRFGDDALDDTLAPGEEGLFVDQGPTPPLTPEVGLASRIKVHANVLPSAGGDLRLLRDGINAVAAGDVGDASRIQNMIDAMSALTTPATGAFMANQTVSGIAGDFVSGIGAHRQSAELDTTFATTRQETLRQRQLADGVDTDAEMQKLMMIEQAYAANARVMTVVDEMMRTLMGI